MKCPACNSMMIVVEHERIELDYCPQCAGVWFDAGELELLLDTMQVDQSILSIDTILTAPVVDSQEKKRKCPICRKKMKKATIGHQPEVLIDVCQRGDGLWFDAGEVGQVVSQARSIKESNSQGQVIHFLDEVFHLQN